MRLRFKKAIYLMTMVGLAIFLLVACSKEQASKSPAPEKKENSSKESTATPAPKKPTSQSEEFEEDLSQSNAEIESAISEIDSALKEIDGIDRSQDNEPKL